MVPHLLLFPIYMLCGNQNYSTKNKNRLEISQNCIRKFVRCLTNWLFTKKRFCRKALTYLFWIDVPSKGSTTIKQKISVYLVYVTHFRKTVSHWINHLLHSTSQYCDYNNYKLYNCLKFLFLFRLKGKMLWEK